MPPSPFAFPLSPFSFPPMPVDILAIAAHRDDVELTCAGVLLKAVDADPDRRYPSVVDMRAALFGYLDRI